MDLVLKTAYWDDPAARRAFKDFIREIHGLDFGEWESAGYWDEAYTPFSFFRDGAIVASVCIYLLDAIIKGKRARVAQISGVGTLPEWRRKGLNRQLTEVALAWAKDKHHGVFLFANEGAIHFYEKCGFRSLVEYVEMVGVTPVANTGGAVKLDCERKHDLDRIYEHACRRAPISDKFSILNERLLMFHALHGLRDQAYEIPDLGCIVFLQRAGGCLRILDIVGERVPRWNELYPHIADEKDRLIEFHFHADKLRPGKTRSRPLLGNNCLVKGTFPVEEPVFPFTSRA